MDFAVLESMVDKYREAMGDDRVDFMLSVWKAQSEIDGSSDWEPIDIEAMIRSVVGGDTMWTVDEPALDRDRFVAALSSLLEVMKGYPGVSEIEAPAVFSADLELIEASDLEKALTDPAGAAQRIADRLAITDEDPMSYMLLVSSVAFALQPFAASAAAKLSRDIPNTEMVITGDCPVCGSPAAIGMIADAGEFTGGARTLWCSHCDTTWPFHRVRCARCLTPSPTSLEYIYDKSNPAHRIHVCSKCGGSLPVSHEKMASTLTSPRVEDFAMMDIHHAVMSDPDLRAKLDASVRAGEAEESAEAGSDEA